MDMVEDLMQTQVSVSEVHVVDGLNASSYSFELSAVDGLHSISHQTMPCPSV